MKLTKALLNYFSDNVEKIAANDMNAVVRVTGGRLTENGFELDYTGDDLTKKDRPEEPLGFASHLLCAEVTPDHILFEGEAKTRF